MKIIELTLKNFRNFSNLSVTFHPHINLICGLNAAGKTNLLEALHFLSSGRSFRLHSNLSDLIMFDKEQFIVKSKVERDGLYQEIEVQYIFGHKVIRLNNKKTTASQISDIIFTVTFSPEDFLIIKNSPSAHRRLIDSLLSQLDKDYKEDLLNFAKVHSQRNLLLQAFKSKQESNLDILMLYTKEFVKYATKVINKRKELTKIISEKLKEVYKEISKQGELSLEYFPNTEACNLERKLTENQQKEIEAGMSLLGPMRDDFIFSLNKKNISHFASQAQIRSCIFSFKLASILLLEKKFKEYPILLLDDITSELDEKTKQLIFCLLKNEIQTFITTTEQSIILPYLKKNNLSYKIFKIEEGRVSVWQE